MHRLLPRVSLSCTSAGLRASVAATDLYRPRTSGGWPSHVGNPRCLGSPNLLRYTASQTPSTSFEPLMQQPVSVVHALGLQLLHDPWYNKGTAFPASERERLGLRGLLPPRITDMALQEERIMNDYQYGHTLIAPEDIEDSGVSSDMARRWQTLQHLQDRNETLFYRVLMKHFVEMAPIVYTPTVGWVCTNYHKLYRRPRGMFFSAADKGEMAALVYNWPQADVHAIVVTDGSRILGLGDLGVNGLGISIGKLDLYCAAAGFSPAHVLPCVLDVGTNNAALAADPWYMGLQQPRLTGDAYLEVVDEFVQAVMARWPNAVLQFEDFSMEHALLLLERYRRHHLVFNDDIQGTAATALAGLYGALRVQKNPPSALAVQRVVCVGAGSAGMGVVSQIAAGMCKHGQMSKEQAAANFWVLDKDGLITQARSDLPPHVAPFARPTGGTDVEGASLLEVVKAVKPTVLLGLAGAGRLFTPEVLSAVAASCMRPIIFPMSNPTSRMECTAQEAFDATQGRCLFASGSPQPPVEYGGRTITCGQSNNMYLFPGIALGGWLAGGGIITDGMLDVAAETLPKLLTEEDLAEGRVYPQLKDIRAITARIAAEVIKQAAAEGNADAEAMEVVAGSDARLVDWVRRHMWTPKYNSVAYLPPGIGE